MSNRDSLSFLQRLGVGKRISVIAVGFTLAILVIWAYTVVTIDSQKSDAAVIDLAGRQRMLTQFYMKEVLLAAHNVRADHQKTLDLFRSTLEALVEGGPAVEDLATGRTVTVPPSPLPGMAARLQTQTDLANRMGAASSVFLTLAPGDPGRRAALDELLELNHRLLAEANEMVKEFTAASEADIAAMIRWELVASVLAVAFGIATAWWVVRGVTRPLADCVARAQDIAEGNLAVPPLVVAQKDEIGRLAESFNRMITSLRRIAEETRDATENLNAAGAEILATTQEQASATKQQAAAVQQITSTVEEINQSGVQVSERARQVASTAASISTASVTGLTAVQDSTRAMESIREQAGTVAENVVMLSEKTQAIGEIIATVNDIAEQSNLVALNAAIEAADAGEEGRRFSVVANEIKNLADQAKEATGQVRVILEEIQKGINTSVMLTEEAVKRVELGREKTATAEDIMHRMARSIEDSVNAFQQIVGATNQQQIGLEQVTQALHEIRQTSQQTAASTGQLKEAAGNLAALGLQLRKLVEMYRL